MTFFSLLVALSVVLGLLWIALENFDGEYKKQINIGIWALAGSLVGARAAYVSVNWAYFQDHIIEVFQFGLGGLSWPGAFAGCLITVVLAARIKGIPLNYLIDDLLPLLATVAMVVWLGCWISGCAYGPETSVGFPARDEWGIWKKRVPVQFLGAIFVLFLFWGIDRLRDSHQLAPGLAASLGLGGLSVILLVASGIRADPYPLYNGIRLETWGALVFLGISIFYGLFAIIFSRR